MMNAKKVLSSHKKNSGFVLSLSTLLFMSILIYYSFYYVSSIQQNQGNILNASKISKIAFIQDDVLSDINRVLAKNASPPSAGLCLEIELLEASWSG